MRSHVLRKVFALAVIAATLCAALSSVLQRSAAAQSAPPAYVVTDLGTLGGTTSQSFDLNDLAQAVGSSTLSGGYTHAFLYAGGAMSDLGVLGVNTYQYQCGSYQCGQYQCGSYSCGFFRTCPIYCPVYCPTYCTGTNNSSTAYGCNGAGQVVGVSTTSTTNQTLGFIYNAGVMTPLGTFGGLNSEARDINSAGQVVGSANTGSTTRAFRYSGGTMTDLGTLGGPNSAAYAVNDGGTVVGFARTAGNVDHAFIYSGGMFDLGTLGGSNSYAYDINNSNQIVGYAQVAGNAAYRAFLYSNGFMMNLGTLGGTNSYAWGINNSGKVVGTSETASGNRAFVFDMSTGMRNLNNLIDPASGWVLLEARAVNDAGQITGQGTFGGQTHAFLLSPTAPAAHNQAVNTDEDTPVNVTLTATDFDSAALTFIVLSPPAHGSLSGDAPALTYTPAPGYYGPDSFTFVVRDDTNQSSNVATVSISVAAVPDPPVANLVLTPPSGNLPLNVTLDGHTSYDPDPGDPITSYAFAFGDGTSYVETESSAPDGSFDGQTTHLYVAAGTYAVGLTVADGTASTNTTAAALEVGKGTATVTLGNLSHTYDGTPKNASVATNPEGLSVAITYSRGGANVTSPTEAGEYDVSAAVNDDNYAGGTTGTLTISQAAPAFSDLSSPVITYGAASTDLSGKLGAGALAPGGIVSVTLDGVTQEAVIQPDGTFSTTFDTAGLGASASPYEILYAFAGSSNFEAAGDNTKTLTVNKAAAEVTLSALSHTYDATPKTARASTNPAGVHVTLSYSQGGAPVVSPTDAGSYDVTATVTAANYQGSATGTLVISKATPSFSDLSSPAISYGTGATNLAGKISAGALSPAGVVSVTLNGATQQATIQPDGNFASSFDTGALGASATPYPITYSFAGSSNFDSAADTSKALTVNKATATVTLANLAHTYDGTAKSATASTNPEGLTVSLAYTRGGSPVASPTDAGDYDVAASIDDPNYAGGTSGVLNIGKATPSFAGLSSPVISYGTTSTNLAGKIGAGAVAPPGSVAVTVNGVTAQAEIQPDGSFNAVFATGALGAAADPYPITYSFGGSSNFNSAEDTSESLTVNKAAATVTLGDLSQTYDGTVKGATATTDPPGLNVTIVYSRGGSPVASPKDAGSYDVTATVADANYEGSRAGALVIEKAAATINLSDLVHTYDGAAKGAQATTEPQGLAGLSVGYSQGGGAVASPTEAGEYDVTATLTNDNYQADAASAKLVINKAGAVVTLANLAHTYSGTAKSATASTSPAGLNVVISYSLGGNAVASPTEVGDYDVTAAVNEANYQGSAAGTLSIQTPPAASINDVTAAEGNSGATEVVFTVELSSPAPDPVSLSFTTSDGTAAEGADYTAKSGTLNFAPGETSKTVAVAVKGDVLDEADEGFAVNLSNPVNATLADAAGVCTITDNDAAPAVRITASVPVTEGNTGAADATFTVSLSAASGQSVTVHYATANGTATQPADYTAAAGDLTFNPGEKSKAVTVAVKGDLLDEAAETFKVLLSGPVNATLPASQGTCTITDDDAAPSLSVNSVAVTEGNTGALNAVFAVKLSAPSGRNVTVKYATANGTATSPADYTGKAATPLLFNPGETTKQVMVPVKGDLLDEAAETFVLNLSGPVNATVSAAQGTCTIKDNDAAPGLRVSDVAVTEGNTGALNAVFRVSLSAPSGQTVTVKYQTVNVTAFAPADYTTLPLTQLTFAPGQVLKTVAVAVKGDTLDEANETFRLRLSAATNATLADALGVCTITDNDPAAAAQEAAAEDSADEKGTAPTVEFAEAAYSVGEGDSRVEVAVRRRGDLSAPLTVEYETADGTATERSDYRTAMGTLSFAAGEDAKSLAVIITDDVYAEGNETLRLTLGTPVGGAALGGNAAAEIKVLDNDNAEGAVNPSDDASFFVRQQYVDILGREPEPAESSPLVRKLNECTAGDQSCGREAVSAALLLSDEYQGKAVPVLVLYKVVLGRAPQYREFVREMRRLAEAEESAPAVLGTDEAGSLRRYVERWAELAGALGPRQKRARTEALLDAIRKGAREENWRNEALVLNCYFALLRRDPEAGGLKRWVEEAGKAGTGGPAAILYGFLNSTEYRERFGPP